MPQIGEGKSGDFRDFEITGYSYRGPKYAMIGLQSYWNSGAKQVMVMTIKAPYDCQISRVVEILLEPPSATVMAKGGKDYLNKPSFCKILSGGPVTETMRAGGTNGYLIGAKYDALRDGYTQTTVFQYIEFVKRL